MAIEVNGKYQVRIFCRRGDQTAINVLNYLCTAVTGTPTDQQMADKMSTRVAAAIKPVLSGNAEYYGIDWRQWIGNTLGNPVTSKLNAGIGTNAGDCLPRLVCGLLAWQTAQPGRKGRGRMYVPFPGESANSANGIPDPTYVGPLLTLGTTLAGPAVLTQDVNTIGTFSLTVRNRALQIFNPVAVVSARGKWAMQRRRGDYGKTNEPGF